MEEYDERGTRRRSLPGNRAAYMHKTNAPNVYLDLRHKDPEWTLKRFPGIAKMCREFGVDITKDLIPVRPGAHYAMGACLSTNRAARPSTGS